MGVPTTPTCSSEEDNPVVLSNEFPLAHFRYHQGDQPWSRKIPSGGADVYPRTGRAEHGEEIFNLIEGSKTQRLHVWPQGHGAGIDEAMTAAATAKGWIGACSVPSFKKADRWHVETY